MKKVIWIVLSGVLFLSGCLTTKEGYLRSGYHGLATDKPKRAEKAAIAILNEDANSHAGLLLLAKAKLAKNDNKGALEALDKLDKLCDKGLTCENLNAHQEAEVLKGVITGDEGAFQQAKEIEARLTSDMKRKLYASMVEHCEKKGDPYRAAKAFDSYREVTPNLLPDEVFHGFCLYWITLDVDKAKELYSQLTVEQKDRVKEKFGEISF